jgi:hypothetical protein
LMKKNYLEYLLLKKEGQLECALREAMDHMYKKDSYDFEGVKKAALDAAIKEYK